MIPDMEKVAGDYLRGRSDVQVFVGDRVLGTPPSKTDKPWVMVTQLGDPAVDGSVPDHLIEFMVQFDCYAGKVGGQREASKLTRTVRNALVEMHTATHTDTVVAGTRITGAPRVPDTTFEPARDRFSLTALIYAHAV